AEDRQFFKPGDERCARRRIEEALEAPRRAFSMDERNNVIRTFLLETLLEQARAVMDVDWHAAETLSRQALDLDANHSLAKGVLGMALDHKREAEVGQWVAEARRMQAVGNVQAALAPIDNGL